MRLFTQGSLEHGHFALDLECADAPILPSNWSRRVSYKLEIIHQQHPDCTIQQGTVPAAGHQLVTPVVMTTTACTYIAAIIIGQYYS